jgi:LuxR family maltose regulon positive regulatory protein
LGLANQHAGNVGQAARAFELAVAAAEQAGVPPAELTLLCNLAEVRFVQGRLDDALEICDRANRLLEEGMPRTGRPASQRATPPGAGFVCRVQARIAYERGKLDAAAAHAQDGVALLRQANVTLGLETLLGLLARIEQARGDPGAADSALAQAAQIARGNDIPRLISQSAATEARVWLARGELDAATRWAEAYDEGEEPEYLREYEELTAAWIVLAAGRPGAALALVDWLLPDAQAAGRWGPAIEILTVRALALSARGEPEPALASLSQALERARRQGSVRPFREGGAQANALLAQLARRSDAAPAARYARELLAALQVRPALSRERAPASSPQPFVEPLTPRELDVLALLGLGLTNAEIGERLVISLPTVKSHTRNLYSKLGVHSRREAVARARELGLLGRSDLG